MKRGVRLYGKLFGATFTLSLFTFGGGYVIVPLMRSKFVDKHHWLGEEEMLDLVAIAQSAPGPIAINTSILAGYRIAGVPGALLTVLGTTLPPLIVISLLTLAYAAFRDNRIVSLILRGMQAGVAAVIASVVFGMARDIIRKKRVLSILMMLAAFALSVFLKLNAVIVLLACGVIGAADTLLQNRRKGRAEK